MDSRGWFLPVPATNRQIPLILPQTPCRRLQEASAYPTVHLMEPSQHGKHYLHLFPVINPLKYHGTGCRGVGCGLFIKGH